MQRLLLILAVFLIAVPAQAASLSLVGEHYDDGTVRVTLQLMPEEEAVNAVEGTIQLPTGVTGHGIAIGQSVVSNWVEVPVIEDGTIRFAGIMPGGFIGTATPGGGFTGEGAILSFLVPATDAAITLTDAAVFLNDGKGTRIALAPTVLSLTDATLTFAARPQDVTPPEYLDVTSMRDTNIAAGAYALIFESFDAQSGVAYYEVKEYSGTWMRATSPYVVNDSVGVMPISVRVYDYAGNFRETSVPGARDWVLTLGYALLALCIAAIIISVLVYLRKRS